MEADEVRAATVVLDKVDEPGPRSVVRQEQRSFSFHSAGGFAENMSVYYDTKAWRSLWQLSRQE